MTSRGTIASENKKCQGTTLVVPTICSQRRSGFSPCALLFVTMCHPEPERVWGPIARMRDGVSEAKDLLLLLGEPLSCYRLTVLGEQRLL